MVATFIYPGGITGLTPVTAQLHYVENGNVVPTTISLTELSNVKGWYQNVAVDATINGWAYVRIMYGTSVLDKGWVLIVDEEPCYFSSDRSMQTSDIWGIDVPGAYAGLQAGKVLGDLQANLTLALAAYVQSTNRRLPMGTALDIRRGIAYLDSVNNAFGLTIPCEDDDPPWQAESTVTFVIRIGGITTTYTGTIVTATQVASREVKLELTTTQTTAMLVGKGTYDVIVNVKLTGDAVLKPVVFVEDAIVTVYN